MIYGNKMTRLNVLCVIGLGVCATFASAMDKKPTTAMTLRNDPNFMPELKGTVTQAREMGLPNRTHPEAIVRRAERNPGHAPIPLILEPVAAQHPFNFGFANQNPAAQLRPFNPRPVGREEEATRLAKEAKKAASLAKRQAIAEEHAVKVSAVLAVRNAQIEMDEDYSLEEEDSKTAKRSARAALLKQHLADIAAAKDCSFGKDLRKDLIDTRPRKRAKLSGEFGTTTNDTMIVDWSQPLEADVTETTEKSLTSEFKQPALFKNTRSQGLWTPDAQSTVEASKNMSRVKADGRSGIPQRLEYTVDKRLKEKDTK